MTTETPSRGLTYDLEGGGAPVPSVMIESRAGGQNYAWYSEEGDWADSGASSSASGVTPGIGSRLRLDLSLGRGTEAVVLRAGYQRARTLARACDLAGRKQPP